MAQREHDEILGFAHLIQEGEPQARRSLGSDSLSGDVYDFAVLKGVDRTAGGVKVLTGGHSSRIADFEDQEH